MGKDRFMRGASWLAAAIAMAAPGISAQAQDTVQSPPIPQAGSSSPMGEIIVTARKRAESLQDVPVAVTVLDSETLREKNITNFYDVATEAPGLSVRAANSQRYSADFFIRGQGSTFGSGPGVVTYFAEAPAYTSILGNAIQFYDLASVQVLKGPQGTLFGRSSTGGAVLLTPARPDDEFGGFVEARVGNYGMHEFTGVVNLPIFEDVLSFRAAGNFLRRDGFTRSLTTGQRLDDRRRESYRLSLLFTPAPVFENYTLFYGEHVDETATGSPLLSFRSDHLPLFDTSATGVGRATVTGLCGLITPDPANVPNCVATRVGRIDQLRNALNAEENRIRTGGDDAVRSTVTAFDNFTRGETQVLLNTTTINPGEVPVLGDLTIKNIFSTGRTIRAGTTREIAGAAFPHGIPINGQDIINGVPTITDQSGSTSFFDQYTEEIQLGGDSERVNWLLGYYREVDKRDRGYPPIFPTYNNAFTVPLDSFAPLQQLRTDIRNVDTGFFAQVTVEVVDNLSVTAGYRKSKATRSSTTVQTDVTPGGLVPRPGGTANVQSLREKVDSYTFSVDWEVTPDLLLYAAHRKGYKPGGLNGVPAVIPAGFVPQFAPETLKDIELGAKYTWSAGDVFGRSNLALYHQWYNDIQRNETLPAATGVVTQVNNIAQAKIKGLEIENVIQYDRWTLNLNYSYIDAGYSDYPGTVTDVVGNTFNLIDTPFSGTPEHQGTVALKYLAISDSNIGDVTFSGDLYFQSKVNLDDELLRDPDRVGLQSGYANLNLRIDWRDVMGLPVDAAVFVQNVTDDTHLVGAGSLLNAIGSIVGIYNEPRTYGAELRYRF